MSDLTRITDDIFTIEDFWSGETCHDQIAHSESIGYEQAMINTDHGARSVPDRRNNARVIFDNAELARELWSRIAGELPQPLKGWEATGLNERFRFYRYDVGQKFDWHADGCVRLDNGQRSFVTFMIYLNDDYTGGETMFQRGLKITPKQGKALLFSHWLKHTGSEVSQGRKYVLRSDVMFRRLQ